MRCFILRIILILIMSLSNDTPTIEDESEKQLVESEMLQDSAMMLLKELHDKNDSLLTQYFGE